MKHRKKLTVLSAAVLALSMSLAAFSPATAWFGNDEVPSVSAFAKSEAPGTLITFTEADFVARVSGDDTLEAIVVSTLPQGGILRLGGREVVAGEVLALAQLATLSFVPDDNSADVHTSFSFLPVFSEGGAGENDVVVSLNVSATPNRAPIAKDMQFETYVDLQLYGELSATDLDGDTVTFSIVTEPEHGSVTIVDGGFCYAPETSRNGDDQFTYIATDVFGNPSAPATVSISVCKRPSGQVISYTDMQQSPAHYAALKLREAGVMQGEQFGAEAFLHPTATVSRAEFVAMVAAICELSLPSSSIGTGMADNDDIPTWAQPYIAAALHSGIVNGERTAQGNHIFRASDPITRAEAAGIIDRALMLTDDGRTTSFSDAAQVPAWASQSLANTTAIGLVPVFSDNTVRADAAVTREDAVTMLYEVLCFSQESEEQSGFFSFFD